MFNRSKINDLCLVFRVVESGKEAQSLKVLTK
jgi:hypothetical protein